MKVIKYNKLIRDKIPEHLESLSIEYDLYVAEEDEYWEKMVEKLREEVEEFILEPSLEELADTLEVLEAIMEHKDYIKEELEEVKRKKAEKRGAFKKRLILVETREHDE